jgi:ATP-dependent DNA helicase RecQ
VHPKPTFDGRKEMQLVIRLIEALPEHFKLDHLANILAGVSNSLTKSYKHDELEFFGAGKPHSDKFWCTVIHQGLIAHLLTKEIETYGLIHVTDLGRQFAADPWELKLVEDRVFAGGGDDDDDDEEAAAAAVAMKAGGGAGDPVLLSMLKDLRKDLGKRLKLQPWIIFGDPALEDMSILYPVTFEELKNCQGVGEGKARKFGEEFIKLIKKYVEENEIERPDDFVVKSTPNKSAAKVAIIQSIDRRMDLEDIAEAREMDMDELLSEIEAIVSSGTKLNLDYYIENNLDDDIVEEIYRYFKEDATSDDVQAAMDALGPDYYENEVRLVRLKFLCEIAQ